MKSLSIQVQPDRASELDIEKIKLLFKKMESSSSVEWSDFNEGVENGRYLNFTYGTNDAQSLWSDMKNEIYAHKIFGK